MLAECGVPFILHVGSSALNIADEWMNDGVSERQSARGRAEVIGSKDLMVIDHETSSAPSTPTISTAFINEEEGSKISKEGCIFYK